MAASRIRHQRACTHASGSNKTGSLAIDLKARCRADACDGQRHSGAAHAFQTRVGIMAGGQKRTAQAQNRCRTADDNAGGTRELVADQFGMDGCLTEYRILRYVLHVLETHQELCC